MSSTTIPFISFILHTYSPGMSYLAPSASSAERIGQGAIHDSSSQLRRYAPFTCHVYQIGSNHSSRVTGRWNALRRNISWTMIRFLISSDLPRLTEMRMTVTFSPEGRDGTVKNGGMSSGTFAKDGGISYLGLHLHPPPSLACLYRWHTRYVGTFSSPFHSLLITMMKFTTLP